MSVRAAERRGKPWAAFRSYNFRLFFVGQLVSQAGSWMQKVGQAWLVLELTHSAFALGTVVSLQALPILCGTLFAGVIVDRVPKHRLLLITQSVALVQASLLAALTITGAIQLWQIYILAALLGLVNAFDNPGRLAFLMELVGREKVVNAIGLSSAVENGARLLGPGLAGVVIALWGVGFCFGLNAASFVAVLAALLLMRRGDFQALPVQARDGRRIVAELGDGLRFVFGVRELVTVLIVLGGIGCFGFNFNTIVPLLAEQGLHLGADGFGLLMSAVGTGALIGAVTVASLGIATHRRILLAGMAFGAVELSLSQTPFFATAFVQLALMAFSGMIFSTSCNSMLQLGVPNELRGRVMGLYTLAMAGTSPIGALLTGTLTSALGIRTTLVCWGCVCLFAVLCSWTYKLRTARLPTRADSGIELRDPALRPS
ncbi:MAG TPA: MFS transporter [Chloroflexota bacterium]|nr:MFS transporter [Chloroflexota bacterium]